jgi:hypothetical protein
MSTPSARFRSIAAAGVLLAAVAACDDDPTGSDDPEQTDVVLDVSGRLDAPFAIDTLDVRIPQNRVMGAIIETTSPIVMRYGPERGQLVHSGYNGPFAAIVSEAGTGELRLLVGRSSDDLAPVDYRIRILAVNDEPEHADAEVEAGDGFHREWIEPVLDLDIFEFDLEDGEAFAVDFESLDEDVRLTARVMPPAGAGYYLFLEAGPELTRSDVHAAVTSGRHRILVYSAGLRPDVSAAYRFRVVRTD